MRKVEATSGIMLDRFLRLAPRRARSDAPYRRAGNLQIPGNSCLMCETTGRFRRMRTPRHRATNLSGSVRHFDHESPKFFSDGCAGFVVAVARRCAGRRLAAVARAEPRWRLERNRHPGVVSVGRLENFLAHTSGLGMVEPGSGAGTRLPRRRAVAETLRQGANPLLRGSNRPTALDLCL